MGVVIPTVVTPTSASGAQVIDGSLKFWRSSSSVGSYLKRTPSSGGNRKVFTLSVWLKRSSNLGEWQRIIAASPAGSDVSGLAFRGDGNTDGLRLQLQTGAGVNDHWTSSATYRDTGGWYHVVMSVDLSLGSGESQKIYINGVRDIGSYTTGSEPASSDEYYFNNASTEHRIASSKTYPTPFDGHMSQFYWIDGLSLGPGYFGYNDPLTNTWRPKAFRAEGTTINNGTVWSNGAFDARSGATPATAFNGDITTYYQVNTDSDGGGVNFSPGLTGNLRVYVSTGQPNNGDSTQTVTLSDGTTQTTIQGYNNGAESIDFGFVTNITSVSITNSGLFYAFELDGVIMIDSTTTNLDYGTNGVYLPFDGNSLIGKDQSGKGNDWTPVNFGGSNIIPKATGALPILNTVNGGTNATVGVRTDAYYANLVLATPLVGGITDVSNQINSGSTTKVPTNYGTTDSSVVSNFYSSSRKFDGSNDNINYAASADFGFDGDFTIECFCTPGSTGNDSNAIIASTGYYSGSNNNWYLKFNDQDGGHMQWYSYDGTSSGENLNVNNLGTTDDTRMYHIAVSRQSNVMRFYLDGVKIGNATFSRNYDDGASNGITFGRQPNGNSANTAHGWYDGYISDLRIYRGLAKYTGATTGVQYFIPASTNPDILPETPSGVALSSNLTKVTDGAVAFDGTGDYLSSPSSSDFAFGTGDFTYEAFIYVEGFSAAESPLIEFTDNKTNFNIVASDQKLTFWDGATTTSNNFAWTYNKWTHIAFVKSGSNIKFYSDGKEWGSGTSSYDSGSSARTFNVAANGAGNANYLNGFISNLRIVKGTAVYTSNFTPPTEPLTNITNTKLLCCQSTTSAGAAVTSPSMGGINDGTVWSDGKSAQTGHASHTIEKIFDGDISTYGMTANSNGDSSNLVVTLPGLSSGKTVKFYGYRNTNAGTLTFNHGAVNFGTGPGNKAWVTAANTTNGSSDWFSMNVNPGSSTTDDLSIYSVEVDGTVLIDPVSVYGDASATNSNPFIDDINTVMGQETGYCTFNPLSSYGTLKDGNLVIDGAAGDYYAYSTMGFSSGKWYAEFTLGDHDYPGIGISKRNGPLPLASGGYTSATDSSFYYIYDAGAAGYLVNWTGGASHFDSNPTTLLAPGVYQMALDVDNGKCWMGWGDVWRSDQWATTGNPLTGANPTWTLPSGNEWYFYLFANDATWTANFGQKPLKYAPPEGFQPPNYANLPSPGVVRPDQYVGVTTYAGDGGTQYISPGNFSPDMVWMKGYTETLQWRNVDTVRGQYQLNINTTTAQAAWSAIGWLPGQNGYNITDDASEQNKSGTGYVSYGWKAGGSSNTFNVDDVGYATAAEVNMSAGSLNSSSYDQSQDWTNLITFNAGGWNGDGTNPFNDDATDYDYGTTNRAGGGYATLDISSLTGLRVISVTSEQTEVTITHAGGTTTYTPPVTSRLTHTFDAVINPTSIKFDGKNSDSQFVLVGVTVDGKRLINDDITPTNVPSIAPTGASVGTKNGFSIIELTTPSSGTTYSFAHGLGAKPSFLICRQYETTGSFYVWHQSMSANNSYMLLNSSNSVNTGSTVWASTDMTSTVISDTASGHWGTSQKMLYYAWTDVPGLQKFGKYVGNQNADGPFIELGFRAKLIICKGINDAEDWYFRDTELNPYNVVDRSLRQDTGGEYSGREIDILSNGFKLRTADTQVNESGKDYLYCAWAEAPMNNLYGGQSNAR